MARMVRYEIEKIDGLYCVFDKDGRIVAAFKTLEDAKQAIERYTHHVPDVVY